MALKCKRHTAFIYDRGGRHRIGQLSDIATVQWGRVRDDVSDAFVTLSPETIRCHDLVKSVEPNRHELVIFRGDERVWEGPITLRRVANSGVRIVARDVMHYGAKTVMHAEYDSAAYWDDGNFVDNTEPVVERANRIIVDEFGRVKETLDPPVNVVPHILLVRHSTPSLERKANRRTLEYASTVFEEVDYLAQKNGLDYTVIGRRIVLNDTRVPVGVTAIVGENDFVGELSLTSYGNDSATRAITTGDVDDNGNVMFGSAGGVDPYYGEWEILDSMFDEDSEEAPTQNSLDNAADYYLSGRPTPVPKILRMPENSQLNPDGVLSMGDLVPGVHIPIRAEIGIFGEVTQMVKLDSMSVREDANGEAVTVSLGPVASEIEEP